MYDVAVCGWGLAPSEFWGMTPSEWWRIYERKRPRDPKTDLAGSLTQSDAVRMREMMNRPLQEMINGNKSG